MTTYGAYDAGLPCKNRACKSHGKPHPNCRCYGDLAKGGDAAFCSRDQAHQEDCEYFSGGGDVEIDPNDVIPDEPSAQAEIDQDSVIPDEINPEDVIPDGGNEKNEDLSPADLQEKMRQSANVGSKGDTPGRVLGTAAEGLAKGIAGPVATAAELGLSKLGVPNMAAEDIAHREEDHPVVHGIAEAAGMAGSLPLGISEIALANKAAKIIPGVAKLAEIGKMGKVGSAAVKGFISNGLIQGGDEVSKWLLGQGNPEEPVGSALSHMGAAGLFGLLSGGIGSPIGGYVSGKAEKMAEEKAGSKIASYLAGFGTAASGSGKRDTAALEKAIEGDGQFLDYYQKGRKGFDDMFGHGVSKATKYVGSVVGGTLGALKFGPQGIPGGGLAGNLIARPIGGVLEKLAGGASKKYIAPLTMKILSGGETTGLLDALNHAESMSKGYDMIANRVDSLFKAGFNAGESKVINPRLKKKLDDFLGDGGHGQDIQEHQYQQNEDAAPVPFAEGGKVEPKEAKTNGVATHFPDHNILMSAARGRVSNYLASLRPQKHQAKLAFDDEPDTREQTKTYHKALDIALQPLSVLDEVNRGTIEPEHVKHLNAMYPEVAGLLQRKLTERITKDQLDGKKPSFKVRQGLSLFMGTALSGEFTPQSIQAAQAVFVKGSQEQAPSKPATPSKSSPSLTKADQAYLTSTQARQQRAQKS